MKISIIIPVYRTASTLHRCVKSILKQDFHNWEIILVDDGSDDDAPKMCDYYAQMDKRIITVHQTNRGLGAARNTGIAHSTGNYLLFIDSDDYITPEALSTAHHALEKHPEVRFAEFGMYKHEANNHTTELSFPQHVYHGKWDYWFNAKGYEHCYACNKLFRRDVFKHTIFEENKKFEDVHTMLNILKEEDTYLTIPHLLYHYCYNNAGITANAGRELSHLLEGLIKAFKELKWQKPTDVTNKAYEAFCLHAINVQIDVYDRCRGNTPWLQTLPFSLSPKLAVQKILGIHLFCKTYCLLRSLCRKRH